MIAVSLGPPPVASVRMLSKLTDELLLAKYVPSSLLVLVTVMSADSFSISFFQLSILHGKCIKQFLF